MISVQKKKKSMSLGLNLLSMNEIKTEESGTA